MKRLNMNLSFRFLHTHFKIKIKRKLKDNYIWVFYSCQYNINSYYTKKKVLKKVNHYSFHFHPT